MKIILKKSFSIRYDATLDFIAYHNKNAAKKFNREIKAAIKNIPKNPLIFRKSIYFEDNSIRDLIFKGYTVVFQIKNDSIEVFGFVKNQENPVD